MPVGGQGVPSITIPDYVFGKAPKFVWNQSVKDIKLDLNLEPVVSGLFELRTQVHEFYQDFAEVNQESVVNAQIAKDIADQAAIDAVRICPIPRC